MIKVYIFIVSSFLMLQNIQDARMLGLSGAYSAIVGGYRAVGINPANINNGTNSTINIFSSKSTFLNNLFTLDRYNEINGSHFDNTLAASYYPKEKITNALDGSGLRASFNSINSIPSLNFSKNNYAFTSNIVFYGDFELPQAFVEMTFFGNEVGEKLNMAFSQTTLIAMETGFSYCKNFEDANLGATIKYLQGFYYSSMEKLGNPYVKTDTTAFLGKGNYLIKQGLGGNGIALDIGFSTKEFDNGMKFGISLINAFSSIEWNKNTPLRKGLEGIGVNFPVRDKEYYFFTFNLDSLNAEILMGETVEDMFKTDTYKASVINFSDIPQIDPSQDDLPLFYIDKNSFISNNDSTIISSDDLIVDDSKIVVLDDGRVIIPTENLSDLNSFNSLPFKIDYPTYLRMGFSKNLKSENIVFVADIMTGFDNMFGNEDRWKLSLGTEITKNPKIPIRFGVTLGGEDRKRIGFGTGYYFGSTRIDIACGFIGGFSLYSTKGMELGLNIFYDYGNSNEERITFIDKIKDFFINLGSKIKKRVEK